MLLIMLVELAMSRWQSKRLATCSFSSMRATSFSWTWFSAAICSWAMAAPVWKKRKGDFIISSVYARQACSYIWISCFMRAP